MGGNGHRQGEAREGPRTLAGIVAPAIERVLDRCLRGIPVETVLVIGAAGDSLTASLARRGLVVTWLSVSPTSSTFPIPAEVAQTSAERLPCFDCEFDLVLFAPLLRHLADPRGALREARRVGLHRVAVLEWPRPEVGYGPPSVAHILDGRVTTLARQAGFARAETIALSGLTLYLLQP